MSQQSQLMALCSFVTSDAANSVTEYHYHTPEEDNPPQGYHIYRQ
jgi:hypothetical protein